jgi:3-mercaptopyruvate sulfurtransferase SseA
LCSSVIEFNFLAYELSKDGEYQFYLINIKTMKKTFLLLVTTITVSALAQQTDGLAKNEKKEPQKRIQQSTSADNNVSGINGNLVSVDWLEKNMSNTRILLLDASSPQEYAAAHLPGAINFNLFIYGGRELPVAEMEKLYQSWGISAGKKIVLYDEGAGMMATRFFFSLYYHGFSATDMMILDGGLYKWKEKGFPVTKDITPVKQIGTFTIRKKAEDVRVKLPEFLTAAGDPVKNVLLESLTPEWHFGQVAPFGKAGHIPNAIMIPSADFYNPDKTFKSATEIKKMMDYHGIRPQQQINNHCGGGVAASVPFFALKFILKYPNVKLFMESQLGWVSDERDLPYWTYDAPYMMRETSWLQSWGGRMMRMYGISQVSVLDIRSADEFYQGHVPFAINIPTEKFNNNRSNSVKLSEMLGAAGADASHEIIIISGAGLTKEAALVFAILEQLGHKKISIFTDSLSKWTKPGFTLIKDSTVIGPKKHPYDVSIPPTTYLKGKTKDIILAESAGKPGLYPKVFLASGKNVPARLPEGKVVHVPNTDLLNGEGKPKEAKEIWNILTKAGVPRYAELICISEDAGEAAVNYFILKLMGYPDIKILTK